MQILDTSVDDPELAAFRVETDVSKDVIRLVADVKSVDAAFVSTSVRRSDMSLACTIVPTAPTAPSPKPIRVWKAK